MSEVYKRDFIWMRYRDGAPEKVSTGDAMHQKMVAGFVQCAPPDDAPEVPQEFPHGPALEAEKETE